MQSNQTSRETLSVVTENQVADPNSKGTIPLVSAEKLTKTEVEERDTLVNRFKQLADHWVESVGILVELREKKLYRESHDTFEEFCRDVLGMSKSNANRQCQSLAVANILATRVANPANEGHVRPLHRLKDEAEQVEAYRKAVEKADAEKKPLTGKRVADAVKEMLKARNPEPTEPRPLMKADVTTRILRDINRYLEKLPIGRLEEFEKAIGAFKESWIKEHPVIGQVPALKVEGKPE